MRQAAVFVLRVHFVVTLRFFRLLLQRPDLLFNLADNIVQTHYVVLRIVKLAQRFLFAVAVFGDTGAFLEKIPPLFRFRIQNLIDFILTDDTHGIFAQSRISKQIVNILQTAFRLVNQKFTLARTENAPRYHDFLKIERQSAVAVVKRNRNLRSSERTARTASRENYVLRFAAAQIAHVLLAQHPADGISNITLAAAVRADDCRYSLVKFYFQFIGKRLKTVCFKPFQLHKFTPCFLNVSNIY